MVMVALAHLKDRNGSSSVAIKRSITASNPDLRFAPHLLRNSLKKGVEKELLIKASERQTAVNHFSFSVHRVFFQPTAGKKKPTRNTCGRRAHTQLYRRDELALNDGLSARMHLASSLHLSLGGHEKECIQNKQSHDQLKVNSKNRFEKKLHHLLLLLLYVVICCKAHRRTGA